MTFLLPLSSSLLNPIDMEQFWNWLVGGDVGTLYPNRLFTIYFFLGILDVLGTEVPSAHIDERKKVNLNVEQLFPGCFCYWDTYIWPMPDVKYS